MHVEYLVNASLATASSNDSEGFSYLWIGARRTDYPGEYAWRSPGFSKQSEGYFCANADGGAPGIWKNYYNWAGGSTAGGTGGAGDVVSMHAVAGTWDTINDAETRLPFICSRRRTDTGKPTFVKKAGADGTATDHCPDDVTHTSTNVQTEW